MLEARGENRRTTVVDHGFGLPNRNQELRINADTQMNGGRGVFLFIEGWCTVYTQLCVDSGGILVSRLAALSKKSVDVLCFSKILSDLLS